MPGWRVSWTWVHWRRGKNAGADCEIIQVPDRCVEAVGQADRRYPNALS